MAKDERKAEVSDERKADIREKVAKFTDSQLNSMRAAILSDKVMLPADEAILVAIAAEQSARRLEKAAAAGREILKSLR